MANPIPRSVVYTLLGTISVFYCIDGTARRADVRDACSVTRHRSLCYRSLAPFSNAAGQGPHWWARAAVSVTISETRKVGLYLSGLKKGGLLRRGKNKAAAGYALSDCRECLGDALSQLRGALGELRRLRAGTFVWQMTNVETWVSAALTDGETYMDGLSGVGGPQARALRLQVRNVTYFTSNALALVNKLATSGLQRGELP